MTAPAGSEDAGLVLSAEERRALGCQCTRLDGTWHHVRFCPVPVVERILPARVEAARAEERERIAAAIDEAPGFRRWIDDSRVVDKDVAIHIARTPPPAGDGRGRGRDDESGRGAGL